MAVLTEIQNKLKAPKNQHNSFGNYNYRSCEDILEALKPLLSEHNAITTISDELVQIGNRYYVRAVATFTCGDETKEVTAYAREEESKKGMDSAQLTGSCSSYARKYALNGLFLIDDTKDADTMDNTKDPARKETEPPRSKASEPTDKTEQYKQEMARWFDFTYGPEAGEEFKKLTLGKFDNPLTIKVASNALIAYNKYLELKGVVDAKH
jgi:hypothetical protein